MRRETVSGNGVGRRGMKLRTAKPMTTTMKATMPTG